MQGVAVCCSDKSSEEVHDPGAEIWLTGIYINVCVAEYCSVLQCDAGCCSVMQCVAVINLQGRCKIMAPKPGSLVCI